MTNKGTVLITVLWVVLVLSVIAVLLAAGVRAEMASSLNSFDSDRAFYMANGAAQVVYKRFALLARKEDITRGTPIREENGDYIFGFESGEVRVRLESAAGSIDLNGATDKLLASMFDSIDIDEERRNRLVDSILDWRDSDSIPHLYGAEGKDYTDENSLPASRPRNAPFESVDELLLVKNMTPDIFYGSLRKDPVTGKHRRIPGVRDMVTVQSGKYYVSPNEASRDVLAALPMMPAETPDRIIAERTKKPFDGVTDFVTRVPEMFGADTLQHVSFEEQLPTTGGLDGDNFIVTNIQNRTTVVSARTENSVSQSQSRALQVGSGNPI